MEEKEFRKMMADPDVPLSRKLWYIKALVRDKDVKGIITVMPGFLASVEDLILTVDPETEIAP